jgi:hypothetical protein
VFLSIGRGRDESIRLGGSYKMVARYSQQIPKHDATLALVFQGVDIQAPAAKPKMLHAMSIWRVLVRSGVLVKTKQSALLVIERRLAFRVGTDGKHRYLKSLVRDPRPLHMNLDWLIGNSWVSCLLAL